MKKLSIIVAVSFLLVACSGGGDAAAPAAGSPEPAADEAGYSIIDPAGLKQLMSDEDVYLVNVHVPYEGELPDTDAFIPYTEIAERVGELPFDERTVVIYCRSGSMSTEAANAMVAAGAPHFYELGGGWYTWQDAGLPFEVN